MELPAEILTNILRLRRLLMAYDPMSLELLQCRMENCYRFEPRELMTVVAIPWGYDLLKDVWVVFRKGAPPPIAATIYAKDEDVVELASSQVFEPDPKEKKGYPEIVNAYYRSRYGRIPTFDTSMEFLRAITTGTPLPAPVEDLAVYRVVFDVLSDGNFIPVIRASEHTLAVAVDLPASTRSDDFLGLYCEYINIDHMERQLICTTMNKRHRFACKGDTWSYDSFKRGFIVR